MITQKSWLEARGRLQRQEDKYTRAHKALQRTLNLSPVPQVVKVMWVCLGVGWCKGLDVGLFFWDLLVFLLFVCMCCVCMCFSFVLYLTFHDHYHYANHSRR